MHIKYRYWLLPATLIPILLINFLINLDNTITENEKNFIYIVLFLSCSFFIMSISISKYFQKLVYFLIPIFCFYFVELLNGTTAYKLSPTIVLFNLIWYFIIFFILNFILNNARISLLILSTISLILGIANHYVLQFRGKCIMPGDILSFRTALNVSNNYSYTIDSSITSSIVIYMFVISLLISINYKKEPRKKNLIINSSSIAISIIFSILVLNFSLLDKVGIEYLPWFGNLTNGFVLNFVVELTHNKITKPVNYSTNTLSEIETKIQNNTSTNSNEVFSSAEENSTENFSDSLTLQPNEKPNIIVIMNESYSDLSVLGNFSTSDDVLSTFNSLTNNVIKGYALSSVYGGGTANSEYEFLTGNTMAFLPSNSVAYQSFINKNNTYSLVSTLNDYGYNTISIHPYSSFNYNRTFVYKSFGFDKSFFYDDLLPIDMLRLYPSDHGTYSKIIDCYENKKENEPLFIFAVTMQNHGGYTVEYGDIDRIVDFSDSIYNTKFPMASLYLSLVKKSEQANQELIDYFSSINEPTLIFLFGDHQPKIEEKFIETLMNKRINDLNLRERQKLYTVPFFLWTNYKIESSYIDCTSINYLSNLVLDNANLDKTSYGNFLEYVQKSIPAINANGYIDNNGKHHSINNNFSDISNLDPLNEYRILQYNNMFDNTNKLDSLYSISTN